MSKTVWDAPNPDGWPRSGGRFSFDEGATGDSAEASFSHVVEAGGADRIDVGSGDLLLNGSYDRDGSDLILSDGAGHTLLIKDYFLDETPADLVVGEGMRLDGDLVTRLAGGPAPGQVAQAATLGGDAVASAIGTVTKAAGTVTVIRTDGTEVTVHSGDSIFQGDVVATSADGGVGITFLDGSAFSLGASGRMVLDEMVYDPGTGEGASSVSLVSGVFSFVSGEIAKSGPDAMAVTTPVGTIGIRGTKGVITLVVPEGADLGDLGSLGNRVAALGLTFEVVLLPEANGTTGEIIFTGVNGQTQTLNTSYDGIKVNLARVLDQVELSVSRFSASQLDMENNDRGRSLDFLPDGGAQDGEGNGNDHGGIDPDGDGRPQISEIIGQDRNYSDPFNIIGSGLGEGGGSNSGDIDRFVKEILKTVQSGPTTDDKKVITEEGPIGGGDIGKTDTPVPPASPDDPIDAGTEKVTFDSSGRIIVAFSGGVIDLSSSTDSLNITGGSSGDTITTGSGSDLIFGGAGGDTIKTNGGNDIVFGGAGGDIIIGGSGRGNDTYYGGSSETVDDSDSDWIKYPSATHAITVNLSTGTATGSDIDTDILYGIEHVLGGDGSDTITGNSKANILQGGTGDDTLDGGAGNDTLEGGDGNDTLVYSSGTDTYTGGSGTDTLLVQNGTTLDLSESWQSGSSGLESITLGSGANTLAIGSLTSWSSIFGTTLTVNAGSDDTVSGSGWTYGGTIVSGDVIYHSWTQSGATLHVQDGAIQNFTDNGRTVATFNGGTYDGSSSSSSLLVVGSSSADSITTGSGNDLLQGLVGNDTLAGGAGTDILQGGDGDDTLVYSSGADTYTGGSGTDTLLVQSGTTLDLSESWQSGSSGLESITLGSGANTLAIGSLTSWSSIFGTTLTVNAGSDDTVSGSGWAYGGTIVSGDVIYHSWTQSGATLHVQDGAIQNFTDNGRTVAMFNGGTYDGSSSSSSLLVVGRSSDDTITTGSGNDLVYGGAGNDTIKTNGGNDIVFGGAGADVIIGGSGLGNDTYYGGSSESVDDSDADWITYSSATNAIIVNLSTGTATGTDIATDTLYGIENVLGGDGADTITGNSKANILQGGTGDDTLDGGAGNDTLEGGDGNDTLVYSSGADTYTGGSGTDTLLVQSGTTLDLSESWQSGSSGLESITLGSGANTLAIGSLTSWSSIFGTTLTVNAGSDDTVSGSGWTYGGTIVSGEVTYNSWSQNGYTLNIEYGAVLDGLTTLTWDGGASSTTFTDAANWNPDRVPGTGDVIRISGDSTVDLSSGAVQAISITGTSTLNVADGLVLTNGGSIEEGSRIKLASGGTLDTDGTLTFDGRLYLEDAGTLSGDGVININRSGILLPSGGSLDIDGLTLNFNNDLTLGGSLVQRNYSTVVNASGNTLTIDDAGSISGTGTFQILGTVNVKIDSEESFTFGGSNTVLYSSGVIKATTGNVSLGSGSYLGSIEAALGTTVTLTGSQAYYSGAGWSGAGAFVLSSGSIALKADLSTTVGLEFSGSNHITGTESESGTKYGTLTVDSFSQSSVGTVDFDAALLKLSNGGSLSGSTLMGDGTLQLDGGTFIVSGDTAGTTVLTLDTVVTNGATLAVRAISQATTLDLDENGETGSLTIESGGTLSLDQYASGEPTFGVTIDGGTGTIINNGLVWVSDSQGGSTGVVNINGAFVLGSTGTLDVDSTLYLSPGVGKVADLSNGTVDIASGKTVYVSSGTLATGSGTTYGGSGTRTLQFLDGTTWRMGADYTISASTFQIGLAGAVSVVAAAGVSATLTNAGTTAFFSDDTIGVDVVNTGDLGFHAHDAAAGIDGGSTLSGDLTNSGTITVYNGATHEDQAAGNAMTTTVGGTIDNSGLFLFSNGSDTGNLKFDLDTHAFNNSGGVTFANAANTTYEIESTFNNSGTVDLQHDATFSGGSFNNLSGGTIWLENSSTLTWDPTSTGSEFSNDSGGLIQGTGTITLYDSETSSDLTLFNSGTLSPGIGTGSADSSHGSLTINGNLMAKATSLVILDFDLYGEFGHDSLIVSNTFTMAGTLDIHVFGTASGATSYTGYLTAGTLAGQFDEITGMNSTAGATVGSYALHPSLNGTTELTFKSLSVTAVGSSFNNDNRWGDVVIGTSGNDTFLVSGTHSSEDFFYGGDGNDTVTLASLDPNSDSFSTDPQSYSNLYFDFLDGGAGTDTLRIENTTNLTSVSWEKVQGFEIIDFNAEGGTLTIDDTIVKALASGTNGYLDSALSTYNTAHGTSFSAQDALVIDLADSSTLDKVGADMGAWEDKGTIQLDLDGNETNESYTVYTHGDATIYVHDGSDSSPVVAG